MHGDRAQSVPETRSMPETLAVAGTGMVANRGQHSRDKDGPRVEFGARVEVGARGADDAKDPQRYVEARGGGQEQQVVRGTVRSGVPWVVMRFGACPDQVGLGGHGSGAWVHGLAARVGGTGWGHGYATSSDEGRTRAGCSAWALAVAITAATSTSGACTGDQDGMQPDAATPRAAAETMDGVVTRWQGQKNAKVAFFGVILCRVASCVSCLYRE